MAAAAYVLFVKTMNETPSYTVMVDDNFNFYDEDERYCAGTFSTLEGALDKSMQIVGKFLLGRNYAAQKGPDLCDDYKSFGDDPFIQGPMPVKFSAWEYAEALANILAGKAAADGPRIERRFRLAYLGTLMMEARDKEAQQ